MTSHEHRPLTRTVLRLREAGMPISEIAWRLRRSPGHISRILEWTNLPRSTKTVNNGTTDAAATPVLRPLERRVVHARQAGIDRAETAARLRRSPQHIAKIEAYADAKLAGLT